MEIQYLLNDALVIEEIAATEPEVKEPVPFDNYSRKYVTLVGYLIGLDEGIITKDLFGSEHLGDIKYDKNIEIIRALSKLRLNFLCAYEKIYKKKLSNVFIKFEEMNEIIDVDSLKYLKEHGINALRTGINVNEFTKHILNINQLIEENIDNVRHYVPEWAKWEYIRDLFIMPDCACGQNECYYKDKKRTSQKMNKVHVIRKDYYNNMNFYPYHIYLNWNKNNRDENMGNILFNDNKFFKLLYGSRGDVFRGEKYVINAKDAVKDNIYEFVKNATNVAIFVDCENVNPYYFAATLRNLEEQRISKIKKIVLYDDVHTTNAWDLLQDVLRLNVEHEEVERVKGDKSLVDHALSIGVSKAVYKENMDSVIIVSSDSDFWSLIRYMEDVNFLVMNERRITSSAIITKLDEYGIPHCYMDEFAQDVIQPFKNKVLEKNLNNIIDRFNQTGYLEFLSIDELMNDIFNKAGITDDRSQVDKEKENFYKKYLKKLKLVITDDNEIKIVVDA